MTSRTIDKQHHRNDLVTKAKAKAKDRSGLRDLQQAPAIGKASAVAAKKIARTTARQG